jgi:hypothetical protein
LGFSPFKTKRLNVIGFSLIKTVIFNYLQFSYMKGCFVEKKLGINEVFVPAQHLLSAIRQQSFAAM